MSDFTCLSEIRCFYPSESRATVNHASIKVNIDWLSIITEPISVTLTYAMFSGQAKWKVQRHGKRKLD